MNKYERQKEAVEREEQDILAKSREITGKAADEGRALTEDEDKELQAKLKQLDVLKEKKAEIKASIETLERVDDLGKSIRVEEKKPETPDHRRAESLGEAFVKSDGYKKAKSAGFRGSWTTGGVEIEGKALLSTTGAGAETAGGDLIQPDVQPGIQPLLFERLTVSDLIAPGSTVSNLVRVMVETLATNAAAGVAEAGEKPESSLEFDAVDESVKKIATWLPVTDEMLEDVAQLTAYIDARLALFVRIEEENQLLHGEAGGDDLQGIIDRITGDNLLVRATGSDLQDADHVHAGITKVQESFLDPTGIVMHPENWASIQRLKDDNLRYMGLGPFGPGSGPNLWGLPVVVTSNMTEGVALVGAFRTAAQIFRKGGLSVEASNSHSDFFIHNKTAIRAEERLALAVYRPEAFATVDLGAAGALT